jgi:hypothetical protein
MDLYSFPGFSKSGYKDFHIPNLKGYKLQSTEVVMNTGYQNNATPDGPVQYQTSPTGQLYAFSKKQMGPVMSQVVLKYKKEGILIQLSVSYTYSLKPNRVSWNENEEKEILTINNTEILFHNEPINYLMWTEMRDGKFTFSLSSEKASKEQLVNIVKQIANRSFSSP